MTFKAKDVATGDKLRIGDWNKIVGEVERLGRITAEPPLEVVNQSSGIGLRLVVDEFWAKITAVSDPCKAFGWEEVQPVGDGTWQTITGRAGTLTVNPAYETNGICTEVGQVVWMRAGADGEYLFDGAGNEAEILVGCGLDIEADDDGTTISIDNTALAGDGLQADGYSCSIDVLPGDGIGLEAGKVVARIGDGLHFTDGEIEVDPTTYPPVTGGCGVSVTAGVVAFARNDVIGQGLVAGATGCKIDVYPDTSKGLEISGGKLATKIGTGLAFVAGAITADVTSIVNTFTSSTSNLTIIVNQIGGAGLVVVGNQLSISLGDGLDMLDGRVQVNRGQGLQFVGTHPARTLDVKLGLGLDFDAFDGVKLNVDEDDGPEFTAVEDVKIIPGVDGPYLLKTVKTYQLVENNAGFYHGLEVVDTATTAQPLGGTSNGPGITYDPYGPGPGIGPWIPGGGGSGSLGNIIMSGGTSFVMVRVGGGSFDGGTGDIIMSGSSAFGLQLAHPFGGGTADIVMGGSTTFVLVSLPVAGGPFDGGTADIIMAGSSAFGLQLVHPFDGGTGDIIMEGNASFGLQLVHPFDGGTADIVMGGSTTVAVPSAGAGTFTSSGTYTVPAGAHLLVQCWGDGQAGGADGGHGGGYTEQLFGIDGGSPVGSTWTVTFSPGSYVLAGNANYTILARSGAAGGDYYNIYGGNSHTGGAGATGGGGGGGAGATGDGGAASGSAGGSAGAGGGGAGGGTGAAGVGPNGGGGAGASGTVGKVVFTVS